MNEKEKFLQINKEVKATAFALLIVVVYWLLAGFGLAGVEVTVFYMPLWAFAGCFGTAVIALIIAVVLSKKVFKNMGLQAEGEEADE